MWDKVTSTCETVKELCSQLRLAEASKTYLMYIDRSMS